MSRQALIEMRYEGYRQPEQKEVWANYLNDFCKGISVLKKSFDREVLDEIHEPLVE